jgi:hypothetical protein
MVVLVSCLAVYAALQVGVISIAAVLWRDLAREQRRRWLLQNLETVLNEEKLDSKGEKFFTRAA